MTADSAMIAIARFASIAFGVARRRPRLVRINSADLICHPPGSGGRSTIRPFLCSVFPRIEQDLPTVTIIPARVLVLLWCFGSPGAALAAAAVSADHAMVVTEQHLASAVGTEILKQGGNAVDAAVAVGYAEAVVYPCCGNLGGGGFMTIHLASGRDTFIDFRETAPGEASAGMYLGRDGKPVADLSRFGYRAVAVPGTVLGLDTALREYGRLPRAVVMAPAIRLAKTGFVLGDGDLHTFVPATRLKEDPVAAKIFRHADGTPLQAGDRLVQPDLAALLEAIAAKGPKAFYRGAVPKAIAGAAAAGGGVITGDDFLRYRIAETVPVRCQYRGYVFVSAPPPSSGGVALCEILNVLSGYDLGKLGYHRAASVHLIAEAMRHAFMDRNTYLGDPAFHDNPVAHLLSADYAAAIRAKILPDRATPSTAVQPGDPPHERLETTHYSIVDQAGNAVAVTYTLNGYFGAQVAAPGTGVLLNDEMDDFTTAPGQPNMFGLVQGAANAIAPGKRSLSSMTPTIVLKDGKVAMVLGSPNGPRIISTVLQTALNVIDYGMGLQDAVDAPRFHLQWLPDVLFTEPGAFSAETTTALERMGYQIKQIPPFGASEAIAVTIGHGKRVLVGAHDPRSPAGAAAGY
jgi:gamma-glutamyltranspeptidase/glutathione hydrolase